MQFLTDRLFSRRDAIRLMAAGTGLSTALQRTAPSTSSLRQLPRGSIVRTLLRDVPPDGLGTGAALFHEHLSINLTGLGRGARQGAPAAPPPPPATDNLDLMVQLVNKAAMEGVSCIVDGGHADMGRSLDNLRTIAQRTTVHIVAPSAAARVAPSRDSRTASSRSPRSASTWLCASCASTNATGSPLRSASSFARSTALSARSNSPSTA